MFQPASFHNEFIDKITVTTNFAVQAA